ncbi:MAG TPA: leucine--tRNA ligase [Thermomicrobiaceae bacterium]|nr:leucine--tRNA ligase [Thermomicrobiaceae bacterium]
MATVKSAVRSERYEPHVLERKWQAVWEETGLYRVRKDDSRPKWYHVTMYPYPSGDLHIGHWYAMAPSDARARFQRMRGYNVMFPMGFDAFGLPAENAAIKRNIHPYIWTMANIERMREQMRSMGAMFDWDREVITCLPEYYKWNQWFFLQFYRAGLVYRATAPVWWCPNCQTVLANEQVIAGRCERCDTEVYRRDLEQWFFRATRYADELLNFDGMEWPERVKTMQRNWIGRSEGARASFRTDIGEDIPIFTTRPDTLWGATFMVLAPEHPLVERLTTEDRRAAVEAYIKDARRQSEIERTATDKEKTGVFIGAYATNPVNDERVPIWIADYVLMGYGTGAIMAVPAHDQRDFEFARKFGLEIRVVIQPAGETLVPATMTEAYAGDGVMVNSGRFDGTPTEGGEAVRLVIAWLEEQGTGSGEVTYRLRDWLISRQRYWGTPIPIVYCDHCGVVAVPEDQLPVVLPEDSEFAPTGVSPLKTDERFVNTTCPRCGGPARRETDTMDTFVDSSWYYYRYPSPHFDAGPFDPEKVAYWAPVDQYTGGIEHATMHLMYARYFTKALRDLGLLSFDEPFTRLFNQGIILGEDNEKMSKSRGNVVDPDDLVAQLGADVVRLYLMFIAPWDQGGPWNSRGIAGLERFVRRVWTVVTETAGTAADEVETDDARRLRRLTHRTIRSVTEDIAAFQFNTMIARLMEFVNALTTLRETAVTRTAAWSEAVRSLPLMLAPSTPYLAEELWERLGGAYSVHQQPWPQYDPQLAAPESVVLVVQVNGKVRDRLEVQAGITEERAVELARSSQRVQELLDGRTVRRVVYVPDRLVNIVVG